MSYTFWVIVAAAALVFFVLPNWKKFSKRVEEKTAESRIVKFFGGPLDGSTHEVADPSPWYTHPYLPEDQSEWEEDESRQPVDGMRFIRPHWAYYQVVDGESYFYVRDIEEAEVKRLHEVGELPSPVAKDE